MTDEVALTIDVLAQDAAENKPIVQDANPPIENSTPVEEASAEQPKVEEHKPETTDGEKDKKEGGWQRKIRKLQSELAEYKAKDASALHSSEPKAEQYTDITEYTKDAVKWAIAQEKAAEVQRQQEIESRSRVKELITRYPDYAEVMQKAQSIKTTPQLDRAILSLDPDIRSDVVYHLAKNPGKVLNLTLSDEDTMFDQIEAIESVVKAQKSSKPDVRISSNAPKPITPVRSLPVSQSDINSISTTEYVRRRNAEVYKKRFGVR